MNFSNWRTPSFSAACGNCVDVASSPWHKSSHSYNGNCTEVAAWRTSSRCASGECVEAGHGDAAVGVRDTKANGEGPVLVFPADAWIAFTTKIKTSAS
jgi:Domain of unknown function (DUF397)